LEETEPFWKPWFRGHADARWQLKPKLYRDGELNVEKLFRFEEELRGEFKRRGSQLAEGLRLPDHGHRPVQYLNNVLEQDHRAIKRRVRASQHFRSFWGAWRTIAGYEAIHMIRKGQACWSAVGAKVGLLHRFILDLFAAMS
jgi:hypothetical protein